MAFSAFTVSPSPAFLPSLSSSLLVHKNGSSRRLVASYGIPGYGAPRPYQTPARPSSETLGGENSGNNRQTGQLQWKNYGAPADYSTPANYQTPRRYRVTTELGQEGLTLEDVQEPPELDVNGGGGGHRGDNNGEGGGGGGGDGSDGDGDEKKKRTGLSMSQKLTLAYAILVGVGGIMGFAKSGSSKSLMAGGGSASILYYVFLNLPSNPVLASTVGLGISGLLLFIMGSRYMESGKVFPAGVVSLFSLVMAGGYIHGIVRTTHT